LTTRLRGWEGCTSKASSSRLPGLVDPMKQLDSSRKHLIKRALDLALAVPGFFFLAPLMFFIAVMIRSTSAGPVFFWQDRPGLHGKIFRIAKFRTMRSCHDENGCLLPDGERLTPFGRFLRSTSLDELPELFNVLRSEMSLVGPRPLLVKYLDRYTPEQMRRHEVMPGITGWAQVNGRNAITWEEKFRLDIWYVDNHSTWLDLKIIAMTLSRVLKREGISAPGQETMEEFR
jgi:sugar transferase EpsL